MYFIKPLFFVLFIALFSFMEEKAFSMEKDTEGDAPKTIVTAVPPPFALDEHISLDQLWDLFHQLEKGDDNEETNQQLSLVIERLQKNNQYFFLRTPEYGFPLDIPSDFERLTCPFMDNLEGHRHPGFRSYLSFESFHGAYNDVLTESRAGTAACKDPLAPGNAKKIVTLLEKFAPPLLITVKPKEALNRLPYIHFSFDDSLGLPKLIPEFSSEHLKTPTPKKEEPNKEQRQTKIDQTKRTKHQAQMGSPCPYVPWNFQECMHVWGSLTVARADLICAIPRIPSQSLSNLPEELQHPVMPYLLAKKHLQDLLQFGTSERGRRQPVTPQMEEDLDIQYGLIGNTMFHKYGLITDKNRDLTLGALLLDEVAFLEEAHKRLLTIIAKGNETVRTNISGTRITSTRVLINCYIQLICLVGPESQKAAAFVNQIKNLLDNLEPFSSFSDLEKNLQQETKERLERIQDLRGSKHLATKEGRAIARRMSDLVIMEAAVTSRSSLLDRKVVEIMGALSGRGNGYGKASSLLSSFENLLFTHLPQGSLNPWDYFFNQTKIPGLAPTIGNQISGFYIKHENWNEALSVLRSLRTFLQRTSETPLVPLESTIAYLEMLLGRPESMERLLRLHCEATSSSETTSKQKSGKKSKDTENRQAVLKKFEQALEKEERERRKRFSQPPQTSELAATGLGDSLPAVTLRHDLPPVVQPFLPPCEASRSDGFSVRLREDAELRAAQELREKRERRKLERLERKEEAAASAASLSDNDSGDEDIFQESRPKSSPLSFTANFEEIEMDLTHNQRKIFEEIKSGRFLFTREAWYNFLENMGCKMRNKGSHSIAKLPSFVELPNGGLLFACPQDEGEEEDVVGGSSVFGNWREKNVPHYLKEQIRIAVQKIFNYHKTLFLEKQAVSS